MNRTPEETVNTLRDAVLRLRRGLPLPDVSVEELLEDAADIIEELESALDSVENPY